MFKRCVKLCEDVTGEHECVKRMKPNQARGLDLELTFGCVFETKKVGKDKDNLKHLRKTVFD